MQTLDDPPTAEVQPPHIPSSIQRFIDMVDLVKHLQAEKRTPIDEERKYLASWMGWGPLWKAFEIRPKDYWTVVAARLRLLLGPAGFEEASHVTPNSFFTSPTVGKTIWQLATRLGFQGGRVLEPGCGSGQIIAAAPGGLDLAITGIEREPFSASLAQIRFPEANILVSRLEKSVIVDNSFDLIVGNVPFGSIEIYDPTTLVKFVLHNYFIYRALMALRPGGLAILVTSRYTMDAGDVFQRGELTQLGILLGAIRLPSNAFKDANTQVITDILILQRRTSAVAWKGHEWCSTKTAEFLPGCAINEYFVEHPENIVGTPVLDRGAYRNNEFDVKPPEDFPLALESVVERIVGEAAQHEACYVPRPDYAAIGEELVHLRTDGKKEGSFHLIDAGKLVQIVDGEEQETSKCVAEITSLVHIRDAAVELLEAERDLDRPDSELEPLRRLLNAHYDAYVSAYGPIHRAKTTEGKEDPETGKHTIIRRRPVAIYAFSRDPDYGIVLGLEDYDEDEETACKAAIFSHRVNVRPKRKEHAETPSEALALCLDELGTLDLNRVAKLLSIEEEVERVPTLLGDLVYKDPEANEWVIADEYLSGNVRHKLEVARNVAKFEPDHYMRNVEALENVMPEDLVPEEIYAILGATWIEPSDIEQFVLEIFSTRAEVQYTIGEWSVQPLESTPNAKLTSEWGTERIYALALLEKGLNKGVPIVYDYDPATEKRYKNVDESIAAQAKLQEIQNRFSEWVWEDVERAKRLADKYNRLFHSVVTRSYNGVHLTFPGMSAEWQGRVYPWQKDFVWRAVQARASLCAHPVGAGKTMEEIATAMTLKRLGLINRAAVIVPNHLLEQITAEAQRLYPFANILMISPEDLTKERRKIFAARIATGNYDFVVITHSSFGLIRVHQDTERAYLDRKLAEFKEALLELDENDREHQRSIKRIETAMERMRQRQEALMSRKKHDDGIRFEQLGVDYLIVDEAHLYKNLGLPTSIQGLQVQASQRAMDLEMKLRYLDEHNGGRPFASFFTATPMSNSMVEAYVMGWYLAPELLKDYGLYNVDAFASTFIDLQTKVEVSANGASFQLRTRPARFVNFPDFAELFNRFTDLRSPEILAASRPKKRPYTVKIKPSPEVQKYVDELVERTEDIHQGDPQTVGGKEDNMLLVTTHGRMAALDLSLVGRYEDRPAKVVAVAKNVLEVYHRWQQDEDAAYLDGEFKSLQIVFCDLGTPHEDNTQVYGKLKRLLIEGGIPRHGIRYIHDARNGAERKQLFQQCRSGKVAVIIGSTEKLGTGANIQTRAAALHHMDAPYRPDMVEQREGRVWRPGNLYQEVEIFYYVLERTFDAFLWQLLERKAYPYDQLRSGKVKGRVIEETELALSYGQVKATATGDPLVYEMANLEVKVSHLQRLKSTHARARSRDGQEASSARRRAAEALEIADLYQRIVDDACRAERPGFVTTDGKAIVDRAKIGKYLAKHLLTLVSQNGGTEWVGCWSDNDITLRVLKWDKNSYTLDAMIGQKVDQRAIITRLYEIWMHEKQEWRIAETIEEVIENADRQVVSQKEEAARCLKNANAFEQQSRVSFQQEAELTVCLTRKRELDAYTAMVAAARDGNTEKQKDLAQMRERLLKDAPSIDASNITMSAPKDKIAPPRRPESAPTQAEKNPPVVVVSMQSSKEVQLASVSQQQLLPEKTKKGEVIVELTTLLDVSVIKQVSLFDFSEEASDQPTSTKNWREFVPQRSSRRKRKAVVEIPVSWLVEGSEEGGPEIKQQILFSEMTEGPAKTLFDLMEPAFSEATHEITQGQPKRRRERKSKQNAA